MEDAAQTNLNKTDLIKKLEEAKINGDLTKFRSIRFSLMKLDEQTGQVMQVRNWDTVLDDQKTVRQHAKEAREKIITDSLKRR